MLDESNAISVAATDVLVDGTQDMFAHNITNAVYFVDGVTVSVSLQAVNDSVEGSSSMTSCTQGSE